jgi:hypothetical protein
VKNLCTAGLLASVFFLASPAVVRAQATAPSFPAAGKTVAAPAPTSLDPARTRRQQQMSPEEAARDQQLQILEARTGNTSFGAGTNGPARQYDKSNGAFTVRRYKGMPGQEQKRGVGRPTYGINPKGQPLVHDHKKKKKFLLF